MPAEFAHLFKDGSGTSIAGGLNLPAEFTHLCQDGSGISFRRRKRCVICGSIHSEQVSCACFRCGRRHQGDCATVCPICRRCHPNRRRCRLEPSVYFTSRRRSLAIFSNDEFDGDHIPAVRHHLGEMSVICPHCQSRSWQSEKINCCHGGDIVVPWDVEVPQELSSIILSSHVRQNIRAYNTVMAFASTGHQNKSIAGGTFVLGGRSYHLIGSILPGALIISVDCCDYRSDALSLLAESAMCSSFSQIWILDTADATHRRLQLMPELRSHVLSLLHDSLSLHNRLVQMYRSASEAVRSFSNDDLSSVGFSWSASDDLSNFEMASIIERPGFQRNIVIRSIGDSVIKINDGHQLYHALAYPLLFPLGSSGWHWNYRYNDRSISLTEYMRFLLMHRYRPSHIQRCERLALEFYCDAFAQVESRNLAFHKLATQQAKYQAASAQAIMDQICVGNARDIGVPVVLPASFPNSPRYYHNLYDQYFFAAVFVVYSLI
jgi:hypothetical protein